MGPRGQPLWPIGLPKTEDVGHLISTLAARLQLSTPRINNFSSNTMLGKTEVSFEQWNHEVHCVKDHYPESVVQESIVRLLKGAAVDMAQYMGSTTSMAHILQKLTIIFGTMASFDALMQNFYKVTQGNHEKVPSFATRIERMLNQIRLQCPGRVTDLKVQQHLKDCLFHGVCKQISGSIRYLYNTTRTFYSHLMVALHKVESENKEVWEKVRAAMTTDLGRVPQSWGIRLSN